MEMEFQALLCFQDFFNTYFKGVNLLKKRKLAFRSLIWTITDVLEPEFDSWVPLVS